MVCNVISSFKNEKQKQRKLAYPGNFPISHNDTNTNPDNKKDGYIKADQLYYFQKDELDYRVIGYMDEEVFDLLIEFINESDFNFEDIIDNLNISKKNDEETA